MRVRPLTKWYFGASLALVACVPPPNYSKIAPASSMGAHATNAAPMPPTPPKTVKGPGPGNSPAEREARKRRVAGPHGRFPIALFGGQFQSSVESDVPVSVDHDPNSDAAMFTIDIGASLTCSVFKNGDLAFAPLAHDVLRRLGPVIGRPSLSVSPFQGTRGPAMLASLQGTLLHGDEVTGFRLATILGDERAVLCFDTEGTEEGVFLRVLSGLWEQATWNVPTPMPTTSLHFYRVRDAGRTTGFEIRRTKLGTNGIENASMSSNHFEGRDTHFEGQNRFAIQSTDASGAVVFVGHDYSNAPSTLYRVRDGRWTRDTGPDTFLPLDGAPVMGNELGLRKSLLGVARGEIPSPFTYATGGHVETTGTDGTAPGPSSTNGKKSVFYTLQLSQVALGTGSKRLALDEAEEGGDHDLLELDENGVVFRETHFVKDGAPSEDEHVRQITERIAHFERVDGKLVQRPE